VFVVQKQGAIIAGAGDISFNAMGYILIMANCVITAMYLVLIAKKTEETKLDSFGLMYYNNILSLPIVIVLVFLTEANEVKDYPRLWDWGFLVCAEIVKCLLNVC